jgi:hypothetical protein
MGGDEETAIGSRCVDPDSEDLVAARVCAPTGAKKSNWPFVWEKIIEDDE